MRLACLWECRGRNEKLQGGIGKNLQRINQLVRLEFIGGLRIGFIPFYTAVDLELVGLLFG